MTETPLTSRGAHHVQDRGGADRFVVHRPARSHPRPLPSGEAVLTPPPIRRGGTTGWLPALLPLLGSAGSLLLLGAAAPGRRWLVLAVIGSLLLSLCAALVPPLRQRRDERRRRARYLGHLADVAHALGRTAAAQRAAAERLYPDLPVLLALADDHERLWERRPEDHDFLAVRVGRGPVPLATPVRLDRGPDPLAERDPELLAAAEELVRRGGRLEASATVVSLRRAGVLAVTGPRAPARALARFLLAQVAAFHAPDDLRVLAAYPPDDAPVWEWLKWLPHVRERSAGPGTDVPRCLLATTAEQLMAHLERTLRPRLTAPVGRAAISSVSPVSSLPPVSRAPSVQPASSGSPAPAAHLLVVLDGFSPRGPLGRVPLLHELLNRAAELDVTVLCLVERRADEPAELSVRIVLDGAGGIVLEEAGPGGAVRRARADAADRAACEALARRLAPLRLAGRHDPDLPALRAPVRLLELLGHAEATAIDSAKTWRPQARTGQLRVPIGLRGARELGTLTPGPLILDLKEAADGGMGPHGLLVGATGSGKSELLRTIVTGLAVTHPPELLSFILVDFKGGAAFAGLDVLPHSAGLITNLQADLALVDRVLAALQGEQERRQRLLRGAGNLDGIAQYQARRAADPSLQPLPYLLVVVDEFGELLAARPEFLDLFTAIGRVGRSLGVHLLLASQRLDEGRVSGLESHLRYRICLRTFARADSMAVLGTADAHTLPPSPGCGWLKVDSDAPQRFEGAVVSVAGSRRATAPSTPVIRPFEPTRPAIAEASAPGVAAAGPATAEASASGLAAAWSSAADLAAAGRIGGPTDRAPEPRLDGTGTDMDVVVAALSRPDGPDRRACRVWLPPLAATITLGAVLAELPVPAGTGWRPATEGWLRVPVGVVDKPLEQAQEPLVLDFTGVAGHLAVVGAPRSGKSTLLATITAAFALTHPPDAVQLYGIDLGGGLLHQLAGLPHVGAVCGRHDRDKARHLIRELRALVATRERASPDHPAATLPGDHGPASLPVRPDHPRGAEPDSGGHGEVLLLVDNWARLRQELGELEPEIEALAASGLHHGVHLVVTANRWADLRLALRDNLGGRLELHLNDPLESAVGRVAAAALPADLPGRGLTATGLRFQAALPLLGGSVGDVSGGRWFAAAAAEIARRAVRGRDGAVAPPLRMLPTVVRPSDLPNSAEDLPGAVPLGLHEHRLAPVWLDLLSGPPHFLVVGDAECGKTSVLRCLARGLSARFPEQVRLVVVDYRRGLSDLAGLPQCVVHACTPAMVVEAVTHLHRALERRLGSRGPLLPRPGDGSRHVLLVDDYHLVAGGGGSPLEPLLDLLAHGSEVGLHVVLTCAAAAAARAAFDPFLRRLHELGSPGLLMSGDPREGPLLGGRAAAPLPPGRGLLVRRQGANSRTGGQTTGLVQVTWTPPPVTTVTLRSHVP
jgi:S-DNA-T family DNA segregation ATPase FtsK/SpoIIIE